VFFGFGSLFFQKGGVHRWGRGGQDTLSVFKFLQCMFLDELLVPD
jgi:hypothetical protein